MPTTPLMDPGQFAEWWTFLSESDEEKLRSGERLIVEGRVHYKGHWKGNPTIGVSVMLYSDIQKLNPLGQTVNDELVVHLFDVVRSDIPTLFATNTNGFKNIPIKEFNKIEIGDTVSAVASMRVNDGKTWLNGTGVEHIESGDFDSLSFDSPTFSGASKSESAPARSPKGTAFQNQSALNEARSMGLDDLASSEEDMHTMYWNIN